MRDGGDFLLIRQELENGRVLHHRLRGISRKVYLACREITPLTQLEDQFPSLSGEAITSFLKDLVHKKIVFQQGENYLSLALLPRH
jgi:hypothetical protein